MEAASDTLGGTTANKYKFLEPVDVEKNGKKIGKEILGTFAEEQMKDIDQVIANPEEFKKQIRKDLVYIYYEHEKTSPHNVIFDPKQVRDDIKTHILGIWYAALDLRKNNIIKDLEFLLENHDKIIPNPSLKKGGGMFTDGISKLKGKFADRKIQRDLLKEIDADTTEDRGDEFYFNKLVEYKKKLFSNNIKVSKDPKYHASGSQAVELHKNILEKIIKHYSGIPRNYLSNTLRRIILGDDAIGYIRQYKTKITYNQSPNKANGIYDLFMGRLSKLINPNNNIPIDLKSLSTDDSVSIEKIYLENVEESALSDVEPNKGGGKTTLNSMPASYVWKYIKSYVSQDYRKLIKTNLEPLSAHIKDAFKDVFRVVNCDALTFFTAIDSGGDDNKTANDAMNTHLQDGFEQILKLLCEKIPDNYAVNILQNYIKNNADVFVQFLTDNVFKDPPSPKNTASNFENYVNNFLNHPDVQPEFPTFDFNKKYTNNQDIEAYVTKLEKCCEKKLEDKDLSPDPSKVPKIIKGDDGAIHLTLNEGLPGMVESLAIPSKDKQYMELPVFEVFKEQFMQCSNDVGFLKELFNMYSSRSIQFMQKVQGQFSDENVPMDEYIMKFILTKHKYTTKIVSECIRHAADLYLNLHNKKKDTNNQDNKDNIKNLISNYTTLLIFSVSKTSLNVSKPDQSSDYIEFLAIFYTDFQNNADIQKTVSTVNAVYSSLPEGKKDYNAVLTDLFALNDTIQPPPQINL